MLIQSLSAMRTALAVIAFLALTAPPGFALAADNSPSYQFDTTGQPLTQALKTYAQTTQQQIIFTEDLVAGVTAAPVKGEYTAEAALDRLLAGTGLTAERAPSGALMIKRPGSVSKPAASVNDLGAMRVAQVTPVSLSQSQSDSPPSAQETSNSPHVEEIIVSAQKTSQRIQDVPVPVSVIDTQALANTNQVLLRDYVQTIPNVNLAPGVQGVQTLAIRGVTTGTGNPTVGVLVDGVPFTAATNNGGGRIIPDLDPNDLERIEVLRGPQGTLYGAASLGGLLNFVTREPSTDGVSGSLQGGTTSVKNGEELGYNFRGSVNVPLSETFAIRASAFTRRDPGFIDDPGFGEEAVNDGSAHGARAAGKWTISDTMSLNLSALKQKISRDATQSVDMGIGDLQHNRLRSTGLIEVESEAYSATFKVKVGKAEITSLSGFNNTTLYENDGTSGAGLTGLTQITDLDADKFVQELRLAMPISNRVDLLAGAFYTDEDGLIALNYFNIVRATGENVGRATGLDIITQYKEWAFFADLTFHVTDRLDVQVGGRTSHIEQNFGQNDANHVPVAFQTAQTKTTPFTYLLTPSFKLSDRSMAYARFASGFRAGGANVNGGVPGIPFPRQFEPDETNNYELGFKGDFLDRMLTVDASVYYIDWKKIQFSQLSPLPAPNNATGVNNGKGAKGEGVELSATVRPTQGLAIDGWVTVSRTELTDAFPPGSSALGLPGFRLPYSSEFSGRLALQQEFAISADMSGFVGGAIDYVGKRYSQFRPADVGSPLTSTRTIYPSYTQVNVNIGATKGSWTGTLFANNLTDQRGQINGGLGVSPANALVFITPRVIGVSLTKSF